MTLTFDFGRNWEAFSAAKLDAQHLHDATQSLWELIGADNIEGRTFLDIGCGSGLFSIAAARCGASRVAGFDVNPIAVEVSKANAMRMADHYDATAAKPHFRISDVLDDASLAELGMFDIVYAWGVLHHTGAMWQAIRNAASLVEPQSGILVIAIYNHHWTSPVWKQIKRLYNLSPGSVRWLLNCLFAALVYVGVWVTTGTDPLHKDRGMDFWYDVVDWLGGYPYEYARIVDVVSFTQSLGFQIKRIGKPRVPTGCNEFVFQRSNAGKASRGYKERQ